MLPFFRPRHFSHPRPPLYSPPHPTSVASRGRRPPGSFERGNPHDGGERAGGLFGDMMDLTDLSIKDDENSDLTMKKPSKMLI